MTVYIDPNGRRTVAPADLDRTSIRRLKSLRRCGCRPDADPPQRCPQHVQARRERSHRWPRAVRSL